MSVLNASNSRVVVYMKDQEEVKKYLPCVEKRCNDLDDILKGIENWMMAVAESDINDLKKKASFIISIST
jgi:hypothetical protein